MARKIKTRPITAARQPLVTMLDKIRGQGASTFSAVEDEFLLAMQSFDVLVADETATQGDIQNGKGDFFNDVLATLVENCSGKNSIRPDVPGLSFRKNKLDVAYPSAGPALFTIETKATGVPKHPRNKKQKHPEGRGGAADLEKRIREAAFKNIDIKGEMARSLARAAARPRPLELDQDGSAALLPLHVRPSPRRSRSEEDDRFRSHRQRLVRGLRSLLLRPELRQVGLRAERDRRDDSSA